MSSRHECYSSTDLFSYSHGLFLQTTDWSLESPTHDYFCNHLMEIPTQNGHQLNLMPLHSYVMVNYHEMK